VANIKIKKYKKGKLEVEGLIQLVEVIGSDCAMGNNKIQRSLANCMNYLSEAIYHSAVGKLYKNIDKTPLTKAISPTLCSGNPNIVFINCVSTAQKDYGHMIPSIKYACSIRECALRDAHATSKDDSDNELDLKSQHKDTLSPPIHLDKTFDEDDLKVENQNQIKEPTIRLNKSNRSDAEEESIQSNRELERNDKIMSLENKISQIANGRGHTKTQSMQVKLSKTIIPALPNHNKLADNYYNDLLNTVHITENEVSQKNALIAKYEKALNSQKESYDNSINEIKQNNDTKLSALRDQVNSLQLSVHQLQSQKNELENQLNAKSSENEKLKQSSTYNEQQTNSLKLKLSTVISAQSEEYKTKDVAKQFDITALKKELSNKESELNQFKITIKEQSNEIKEWKSKLDQVTLLKVQCKDEVNKHKTKLEIVQNAFTELSQKARLEQSKYSELLQQKESVMTEIDSYKTKCEEYIKKYKSELESNSMLEGQISEMKNSNGELSQKYDDSIKELSLLKKDVSTLQETIKSLEVRLTNALAKNETLMREKSELESQNIKANSILLEYEAKISEAQAIQNKGNAYRQEEVDGLNKKISELDAEISENNKVNDEFIIEVNNLRTEIGLANKKIESLDSNKCIAEANYIKANTEIKATNKSLCEKLSAVNDEKGRLLAEIERNKIAEAKSHKYIDSFKEENEELILTNKVLKKKIHDMEEELREFIGSHKDTHKAIASKENMLSDIQTMIKTFRSHHSKEGSKAKKTSFIN
jgi:chromosome segregation ATPase